MSRGKPSNKRWKDQEASAAKSLDGNVQPGSGNMPVPSLKEDVTSADFLVQCKATDKGSYSLKLKELLLTEERALGQMKMPLYDIDIQEERFAVLRWQDFEQMYVDLKNNGLL